MRILSQPKDGSLLTELVAAISAEDYGRYTEMRIVVAYAKLSGVHQLLPHMTSFQAAGGSLEILIGIGQNNTSKEAIEALYGIGASVSIFHSPGSIQRTFHPKAYILSAKDVAWSSVGSSNLTRGGLDTNYEWNTLTTYNLVDPSDAAAFKSLKSAFAALLPASNPSAKAVSPALIAKLHEKGALPSEVQLRRAAGKAARDEASGSLSDIFKTEKLPEPTSKAFKATGKPANKPAAAKAAPAAAAVVGASGFWKRMSEGDVSKTASPGQIIIPKACWQYFPSLGDPQLTPSGGEQADSYFDVIFNDGAGNITYVANARRIHYVPAASHKRKNQESRFTFRHRAGVFDTLKKGDVLEFRQTTAGGAWFSVTRVPKAEAALKYADEDFGDL